jgi:proline dehydrogenase
MLDLCEAATKQNTRIWIDAEQQLFQGTIDNWTIGLMQKYNRRGKVLVYTTMQAYLKSTSNNITKHLKLAQEEGWAIGIKLVRGAYIASEPRHLIHDTEEETHTAYDSIVQHLLARSFPGIPSELEFPTVQLFLASHNAKSVRKAYSTWRSRKEAGLPTVNLEFGQLQGMADEVSCGLLQLRQQIRAPGPAVSMDDLSPRAFKCLSWGTTRECMQFLFRRAIENRDAVQRTRCWMAGLKGELWRRVKNVIRFD